MVVCSAAVSSSRQPEAIEGRDGLTLAVLCGTDADYFGLYQGNLQRKAKV